MRPEDIQNHDFLVGLRGYDKDDVRSFLAQVASEHATLLAELDDARRVAVTEAPAPPAAEAPDDFENLGASVAAVLRAAKESARELLTEAEERHAGAVRAAEDALRQARADAEQIRLDAGNAVADAQAEADEIRTTVRATVAEAEAEADQIRATAQASIGDARAEADRIVREAADRARQIDIETEARIANLHGEATRREAALRTRLLEASDEIQLALLALGDAAQPAAAPDEPVDLRDGSTPALG